MNNTAAENKNKEEKSVLCQISGKKLKANEAMPVAVVRQGVLSLIKKEYPFIKAEGYISRDLLKKYRERYIETIIEDHKGELSKLDKEVVKSLVEHKSLVRDMNKQIQQETTFAEKLSDKIANFGGSWAFIIIFMVFIFFWVVLNAVLIVTKPIDPFPFILLNLFLSCIAALQAPVILMSQNRKDVKDRLRAENDYKINLKAELEIRALHEKIDNLTQNQWERLLEIQQLQLDMIQERGKDYKNSK